MKNIAYKIILPIFSIFFLLSCEDNTAELDLESIGFAGSRTDIIDLFGADAYNKLLDFNIPINTGSNPQNVEGQFNISVPVIVESTDDDLPAGTNLLDIQITFLNQFTNEDFVNEISYSTIQIQDEGTFTDSGSGFISGDSNGNFTIFVKGLVNGFPTVNATIISGRISATGVFNYSHALITDIESINSDLTGFYFEDDDGFSERL